MGETYLPHMRRANCDPWLFVVQRPAFSGRWRISFPFAPPSSTSGTCLGEVSNGDMVQPPGTLRFPKTLEQWTHVNPQNAVSIYRDKWWWTVPYFQTNPTLCVLASVLHGVWLKPNYFITVRVTDSEDYHTTMPEIWKDMLRFSILFQYCPYVWIVQIQIYHDSHQSPSWFLWNNISLYISGYFWMGFPCCLIKSPRLEQRVFSFNLCPGLSRDDQLHPDFGALAQV